MLTDKEIEFLRACIDNLICNITDYGDLYEQPEGYDVEQDTLYPEGEDVNLTVAEARALIEKLA